MTRHRTPRGGRPGTDGFLDSKRDALIFSETLTAGASRRPALSVGIAAPAATLFAGRAAAFDSKGHVVIEALAYRTLVEGHDGRPPPGSPASGFGLVTELTWG